MSFTGAGAGGATGSGNYPPNLTFDKFREGFAADQFLAELLKNAVSSKRQASIVADASAALSQTRFSLDRVRKLLKSFDRTDEELESLSIRVAARADELQTNVGEHENEYLAEVEALEHHMETVRSVLKQVESHNGRVSQTATRIGDRLQTADTLRQRAAESAMLIQHLQRFSLLPDAPGSFEQLPEVFFDNASLPEAAALARRLLALAKEAHTAKLRTLLVTRVDSPRAAPGDEREGIGSVEYAIQRLEAYSSWLENRVLTRFDEAMEQQQLDVMAQCAHIMAQFDRERTVIQRYVASRPIFLSPSSSPRLANARSESTSPEEALAPLEQLFDELREAVAAEAVTVRRVFPTPKLALDLFLQVICEQRLQTALEELLQAPGPDATAAELCRYLRLLAAAYQRTSELVVSLEEAAGGLTDLAHVTDDLFIAFLNKYPEAELTWLQRSYHEKADAQEAPELSKEFVAEMLAWNRESCERCVVLCATSHLPRSVRLLFHSSSHLVANTGCLLEQIAMHLISSLNHSMELCAAGFIQPLASLGTGLINRTVRRVLSATATTTAMMAQLQAHYNDVVLPRVVASISEHAACNGGLAAVLRAVEDTALGALHFALNHFFGQLERVLYGEQRRTDFAPTNESMAAIDRPTIACMMATAMVTALEGAAREALHGSNLVAFLTEAGFRLHDVLAAHMQRFVFTPVGALKWKKDMAEYTALLHDADLPGVSQKLASLAALVNVLIVAPESLLGLVNGTLRMAHKDVLRFIQLRSDFKTARVEGKTLQQIFTEDAPADGKTAFAKK